MACTLTVSFNIAQICKSYQLINKKISKGQLGYWGFSSRTSFRDSRMVVAYIGVYRECDPHPPATNHISFTFIRFIWHGELKIWLVVIVWRGFPYCSMWNHDLHTVCAVLYYITDEKDIYIDSRTIFNYSDFSSIQRFQKTRATTLIAWVLQD